MPHTDHDYGSFHALLARGVPAEEMRYDPTHGWLISPSGMRALLANTTGNAAGRRILTEALESIRAR